MGNLPGAAQAPFLPMPANPQPARALNFQWARVALLCANVLWTTLCLGGFLPGTRVAMTLLTAALVAVHLADPARGTRAHLAGMLFLPFLAYAAANVTWVTPVRWLGWFDWLNWAQAMAVFWVVLNGIEAPACRRFLFGFLASVGVVAAALAGYQHFVRPDWLMLGRTQAGQFLGRSSGPFGIPNSLGVLMALLIPPVGWLAFGPGRTRVSRAAGAVALAFLCAGFVLAVSRGAWLALAAAFALRPLLSPGSSVARRVGGTLLAAAVAAAAAAVLYFSFPLMHERVDQLVKDAGERTRPILWRGAWRIFEAHPAFGGGAASFDALFEPYRTEGYIDQPYYAHCDYVNTLADYGAVGFVLLFGAAAVVAWRCVRARGLAGAAFTGLLAFAFHLLVDFHLKIPALAMIVATIGALVTAQAWPPVRARHGGGRGLWRVAATCAAVAVPVLAFTWVLPKYRSEAARRSGREAIDRMALDGVDVSHEADSLAAISSQLSRALILDPGNAQAWSDKAYADSLGALVNPGRTAELGMAVEREARRAVELCPVVWEYWVRLGTGLDMQHRWIEGGACYVHALQLAPMRADAWYYQAYHLSLVPNEAGPAIDAADLSLRLDPGFLLAQALRHRMGIQH
jgi:O-antigen ligase